MNFIYQSKKNQKIQFSGEVQELKSILQKLLQGDNMMQNVSIPDGALSEEHLVEIDLTLSVRISDRKTFQNQSVRFLQFLQPSSLNAPEFYDFQIKDLY